MSGWNYRLFREEPTSDLLIVEAYYDDDGNVWGYVECNGDDWLKFDNVDDVIPSLGRMAQAALRPVLTPADVTGKSPIPDGVE